jgi:hypothetical protein
MAGSGLMIWINFGRFFWRMGGVRCTKGEAPTQAALFAFNWEAPLGSWKPHARFGFVVDARKYEQRSHRSQNQSIKAR